MYERGSHLAFNCSFEDPPAFLFFHPPSTLKQSAIHLLTASCRFTSKALTSPSGHSSLSCLQVRGDWGYVQGFITAWNHVSQGRGWNVQYMSRVNLRPGLMPPASPPDSREHVAGRFWVKYFAELEVSPGCWTFELSHTWKERIKEFFRYFFRSILFLLCISLHLQRAWGKAHYAKHLQLSFFFFSAAT